ncbi:hypothetical protein [Massilia sp. NP310]|uniref:hypothetical protein n=1 Tax=Massilia sp. NP310 TaxID=2861282 RepID=UPI001C62E3DE|nr:hypothetical protein [Massilia sp. NP310]QYG04031.1 hypothetical protein KY496_11935 [Massilia sp. NP310]
MPREVGEVDLNTAPASGLTDSSESRMNRKPNTDLLEIEAAGFCVEIRSGKNNSAKAYIAHKSGFRSQMPVLFRSNGRRAAQLQEAMAFARPWQHLGKALRSLRDDCLPLAAQEFADWETLRMLGAIEDPTPAPRSKAGRL